MLSAEAAAGAASAISEQQRTDMTMRRGDTPTPWRQRPRADNLHEWSSEAAAAPSPRPATRRPMAEVLRPARHEPAGRTELRNAHDLERTTYMSGQARPPRHHLLAQLLVDRWPRFFGLLGTSLQAGQSIGTLTIKATR